MRGAVPEQRKEAPRRRKVALAILKVESAVRHEVEQAKGEHEVDGRRPRHLRGRAPAQLGTRVCAGRPAASALCKKAAHGAEPSEASPKESAAIGSKSKQIRRNRQPLEAISHHRKEDGPRREAAAA